MKNLLNLKGLCRSSQLALNPDGQPTVERRSRLMSIICLFLLLTLGVGQMWAWEMTIYCCPSDVFPNWNAANGLQLNCARAGSDDSPSDYKLYDMTDTGLRKDGKAIYKAHPTDLPHEGMRRIEFKNGNTYSGVKYSNWLSKDATNTFFYGTWQSLSTDDRVSGGNVYFDVQNSGWDVNDVQFVIGHGAYSVFYNTLPVSNTQLYYISAADWTDAWYFAFANLCSTWTSGEDKSYDNRKSFITGKYTEKKTDFNLSSGNYYVFNAASSTNNAAVNSDSPAGYKGNVSSSLNSTQTIKYAVSENGRTPTLLTSGTVPATISMSSYKFVNGTNNSVSTSTANNSLTAGGSNYSATIQAAYTGTTVLTMSSLNSDYAFLGWYDALSGGNQLESGDTYTYYPRTSTTVYARFSHEINHEVTISRYCTSTSTQINSTTAKVGEVTYSEITAPVIDGYNFTGWELGTGVSLKGGDNTSSATIHVKTLSSGAHTMKANYTEVLTTTWKVIGASESGSPFSNWTYSSSTDAMSKKSGHSAESKAYKTFNVTTVPSGTNYYAFKVAESSSVNYGYGTNGDDHILFDRTKTDQSIYTNSNTDHNLRFKPDALGEYEFKIDYTSGKQLSVTFPTAYTVTFSEGTVDGADGSVIAEYSDVAFSSGTKVQSGKSVTFKAPNAKTGYTFQGWYTVNNGSGPTSRESSSQNYTTTITANKTLYACYTENNYTVTVTAGEGGTVASASVMGHKDTKVTLPTATPNSGYYFTGWTTTTGTLTYTNPKSASSAQVNGLTAAATVQANFAPIWRLVGSMNDWNDETNPLLNYSTEGGKNYVDVEVSLNANTQYSFKVKNVQNSNMYKPTSSNTEITYANKATAQGMNNTVGGDPNQTIMTAAAGTYRFTWNITDKSIKVTYPTSYKVTFGKGTGGASISASGSTTGAITSGKYVASGENVTFTQTPSTGYTFAGWYTAASDGSAVANMGVEDPVLEDIRANATVYSRYAENMTTVNLSATNGKIQYWDGDSWEDAASSVNVGVATNCSIKAVPATGYYFAGWVNTEGSDYEITGNFNVETNNNTTLKGKGTGETTGQTLTANFLELNKVYFDNSDVAWENVYVYFGGYWNGDGACVNSAYPAVAMTNMGDGIYWAYVPREITKGDNVDNRHKIAFSSTEETIEGGNAYFTSTKAAQRDDYFYNGSLSMYRPYRAGTGDDKHSCKYYKSGYWVQYYATIGNGVEYYMKINTDNDVDYEIDTLFRATAEGTNYIRKATVRLDNGNKEMNCHISTGYGSTYTTSSNITASNCTDITVKPHGGIDFTLTTTSEGIYTFYLDQSGPQMKLTAVYPASVGDYRVLYTNSSVTVPRTSDVIKTTEESSHTTTMFIDKDAAGAILKLQKCTAITAGNPVWTDAGGTGALLTTYASNFASAGVYKFTVNVSDAGAANVATSATCSLSEIEAYTGPYYIKTDCAPGGWANYTQNAMEQNTINAAGAGYDYYFCRWIESTKTNIKCVIATDYCDAVSDTLVSDDILRHGTGKEHETLPCAGSVRFSYDSKTNTLKRTYLQGANEGNSFCVLKPKEAGYVYTDAGGTTDMFASITKFKDNGNWTYQMDAYVYPGAKGGVYTDYPNSTPITRQELVDTVNNVLMGGEEKGSTRYHVRLVYDFKTDHLMSAWVAGAVDNDIDLSSDFMYIRNGQSQAEQISVASGKKITTAKKAYGVFQFSKDAMVEKMSTWNITAYQLCKYYFSFPFDVNVSDIFGVGTFGTDWRIQKYNGAKRAEKGWFAGDGTTTFWEDVTIDSVLHAYEGYLLMLNRINFNDGSNGVWTNIGSGGSTYLYFPSKDDIGIVAKGTTTVKVPSHECKINRYFTQDLNPDGTHKEGARNHMITDSHWNMLGVPLFADTIGGDFTSTFNTVYDASQCGYLYTWDAATNSLSIANTASFTFNAMYAYMVQYTGDITFNGSVISPSLAARRAEKKKEYTIDLNLTKDDLLAGHTYVELREEADNLFMLNEDMYMVKDSKTADVYTFAGCYDVSANVLSVENHVIPVGVNVKSAGTYTFSMPSNFDGTVTLIDNFTQTRTNLAIEDYEVSLPKGEINDRFLLEINIRQVPTAIDGVEGGSLKDGKAHKYIENGAMYILREGQIYDARGNKVK